MLFNSIEFLFLFLPVTLIGYFLLCQLQKAVWPLIWLLLASLVFYGWWNPAYVILLLISIVFNFGFGKLLLHPGSPAGTKKHLLIIGVVFNLGLLGYFKYANFFIDTAGLIAGSEFSSLRIVLPLAISFFTFQQVAFLVDAYQAKVKQIDFLRYCVFVSFFPQLIAGPIVHHTEIFPRLIDSARFRFNSSDFSQGLSQFGIGLFKKVIIADSLAIFANPIFAESASSVGFSSLDYTVGVIAFGLQIYFDFSAYSDIAIGLGKMFSINLPVNFESPYKSTSIIDFWRRWHITLSRFLKDYLYIPLGGNRRGTFRRYCNLLITMVLGGLWHGAHWHFVFWGFLHGAFLSINHVWRHITRNNADQTWNIFSTVIGGRILTLVAIMLSWIFFRANSTADGMSILMAIVGMDSLNFSPAYLFSISASNLPFIFGDLISDIRILVFIYLAALFMWVLLLPNCQQIFSGQGRIRWQPSLAWASGIALLLLFSVAGLDQAAEFIYFQF